MPMVTFDALPDDARVWVFGSRDPLGDELAHRCCATSMRT
jgi:hypothetical protein